MTAQSGAWFDTLSQVHPHLCLKVTQRNQFGSPHRWLAALRRSFGPQQLLGLYLSVFWLLNTVEKFVPSFGKDRWDQIARYLSHFEISSDFVYPTLWTFGIFEGAAALTAILSLITSNPTQWLKRCLNLSLFIMILFTVGDVVAADRLELQEHSLYFMVFIVSLFIVQFSAPTDKN